MKVLFFILFTALLIANLAFFVGMVRDCIRWPKLHRQGDTELPFGLYLAQSANFGWSMATMMAIFGLTGTKYFTNESIWPQALPWWVGPIIGAFFVWSGTVAQKRVKARASSGEKVFDERQGAISMQSDRTTLWILYLYLLFRGIASFGGGTEISANYLHLLITNPWLQTVAYLFLVNVLSNLYFSRKLS